MAKKRKPPTEKKEEGPRPVDRFARAMEWNERIADTLGFLIFMLGLGCLLLAFYDISQPPNSFSPSLAAYVPSFENTDQMSMVSSQLLIGLILLVVGILFLFRNRLVHH